jgi:peptidoglycan LD-endopeptidase LytH
LASRIPLLLLNPGLYERKSHSEEKILFLRNRYRKLKMAIPSPAQELTRLLYLHRDRLHPVLAADLSGENVVRLNFTSTNPALQNLDLEDTSSFSAFVQHMISAHRGEIGIGGYLEPRVIYRRSAHFAAGGEARTIHLGVDVWAPVGTPLFSPLPAVVHSFADNAHFGDYGPTIMLEHELEDTRFWTLYGHLSRKSLVNVYPGQPIGTGEPFAELGPYPENGDWPPHLHFQIMADLEGRAGDFPGVAAPADVAHYKRICPDPNLILRSRHLGDDEWING